MLSFEIARQDGSERRSVRVGVTESGAVMMDAQDIGPTVERVWGDGDYEFWVTVPPAALAALAVHLLRERYAGNVDAVDAFREFCKERGIEHKFGSWA